MIYAGKAIIYIYYSERFIHTFYIATVVQRGQDKEANIDSFHGWMDMLNGPEDNFVEYVIIHDD